MDYFPKKDNDVITFLSNIINKIDGASTTLGLSATQVTTVKATCTTAMDKLLAVEDAFTNYNAAVEEKDAMDKTGGELKYLRTLINQWKAADGYTSTIGNVLGIVAATTTTDPNTYKAALTVSIQGDLVRLKFIKAGADSVNIYKRKKGSNEWLFLARDTATPYDDHITLTTPGQPEHWEYMAYGVLKDQQIGIPSDILQIIYGG